MQGMMASRWIGAVVARTTIAVATNTVVRR